MLARKKNKSKLATIEMIFDNRDAADAFVAYWLDGGGEDGGVDLNTDYEESSKWDKEVTHLRIKGSCEPVEGE